jgi:hypothetical protein
MKRSYVGLCLAALGAAFLGLWQYTRDEAQIRRRIVDVVEAVRSERKAETGTLHAERLRRALVRALDTDVRVEVASFPAELPSKQKDLAEALVEWSEVESGLAVEAENLEIHVEDSSTRAHASASVRLHGELGTEAVDETRPTELILQKRGDGWKIAEVTVGSPTGKRTAVDREVQGTELAIGIGSAGAP